MQEKKNIVFYFDFSCFDVPLQRKWLISSHQKQKI